MKTPMLISSYSLAMLFYPGRRPLPPNRRRPLWKRILNRFF